MTKNNALLARLNQRGNVKPFSGGNVILQELSFAENGNAGFYSGYDLLPVAAQDVISAAEFNIKQLACPVVMSGLEMLQNSGREAFIDLLEARINVAESTMANKLAQSIYSDGTGSGGKEVVGLNAAVPS
ncbi:MAG: phage major capsid protein, partial [Phycisphaerae bacterium]